MDPSSPGSYQDEIDELRARVFALEETLRLYNIVPERFRQQPQPPRQARAAEPVRTAAQDTPQYAAPVVAAGHGAPVLASFTHAAPGHDRTLENRIASQWFNRIGILAVLIGMAWFLKFAIDNHWIGPLGRVLIGLVSGAGLIAWSERFRSKGYPAFSYSLKAVGSGVLYLSLWAAYSLFHLIPGEVAFAAMILVTAFNGFMAWVQDAELLALYSIAGGLTTPLLVATGGNHEISLFTYLLILDAAVLTLLLLKPWSRLLFAAFTGTVIFYVGWYGEFFSAPQMRRTAFFLSCFFLIFALAPRLVRLRGGVDENDATTFSNWDKLALMLVPIATACLGFWAFYAFFEDAGYHDAGPWLAVGFAAFYLLLLRLPAVGILRGSPMVLSSLHLAAAVVFLTIAIPLKAHGRTLTIGWLVEGAALLWVAERTRSQLLRVLALLCLALGIAALLVVNPPASTVPFFNQRFATYLVAIAACAFAGWLSMKTEAGESERLLPGTPVTGAAVATLVVNFLILVAMGWEIHSFWWARAWHEQRVPGELFQSHYDRINEYKAYAQFTYSALFMAYGALLLAVGFWRRSAFLRWQALVLLALAIGKVFLVDVNQLSQGYRILSFLGLGGLLLTVSFVYQRDWLHLRGRPVEPSGSEPGTPS